MNEKKQARSNRIKQCGPFIVMLASVVWVIFTGCGEKNGPSESTKAGGTLYFGVETPFHGFDVFGPASGGILIPAMAAVNSCIQEPLFRMDKSGNLIPVLGLTATPSENGRTWEIKLRENVFYHDGTAFNADAVVHHWARILDPQNKYRGRRTFQPILDVQKIDKYTVRFTLEHPWPPFLKVISDELYLFAFIPSPKAVKEGTHNKKPVGTGPFKYHKWNAGDHFVVLKHDRYWRPNSPFLAKVVFRTIPDHQTRFASLIAGQLDAITLDRGNLIKKAQDDPSLYTYSHEESGAEIVRINMRNPPLDDIRVRQALALANDQELQVRVVYSDSIPLVHHPFGEWFKCVDDGYLGHDLERAKQLIAEYGKLVEIECLHTNTSRGRSIGELLQQLYKQIGVTLESEGLSIGPHIRKIITGDYQLATSRIYSANDFGPQLYRSLHSNSPTNYSGYRNPEMDDMLEAQRIETDPDKRTGILCEIVRKINREVPFFYRGGRRQHIVARKKIMNLTNPAELRMNLATAWIDDNVRFNLKAFEIEKSSVLSFDCPDPGDTAAVKAVILGAWEGKDDWGATIKVEFKDNDTLSGSRTGSTGGTTKYLICGPEVHWETKSGARIFVTVAKGRDNLDGAWKYTSYAGKFTLSRK